MPGLAVKGWLVSVAGLIGMKMFCCSSVAEPKLGQDSAVHPWRRDSECTRSAFLFGIIFMLPVKLLHKLKDLTYSGPSQPMHPEDVEPAKM